MFQFDFFRNLRSFIRWIYTDIFDCRSQQVDATPASGFSMSANCSLFSSAYALFIEKKPTPSQVYFLLVNHRDV
jgi:hypothetical protein